MVQKRQCQPCFACCQGWMSGEILGNQVRAGHPCPHGSGKGCDVYADRPEDPCRTFVCSWRVDHSPLPDWMRPDQCGAIVLLSFAWQGETVISVVPAGRVVPERTLEWLKAYAIRHNRPMLIHERTVDLNGKFVGLKRLGFGPPDFRAKVARVMEQGETSSIPMKSV